MGTRIELELVGDCTQAEDWWAGGAGLSCMSCQALWLVRSRCLRDFLPVRLDGPQPLLAHRDSSHLSDAIRRMDRWESAQYRLYVRLQLLER